jgi:nicotinamidase-related amidase
MKPALIIIDIQNDYFPGGKMERKGSAQAGLQATKPAQVHAALAAEIGAQS